ncbi:MAG TPA: acyl-CoA dehydrogenase family protein [Ilumatobacteraceae bacterium]|nr:acyl-CoA dehydrogenase family protein [Ilumatobacteraceae bacterium]
MSDEALLAIARAMADLHHPIKTEIAEWAATELATHDRVDADLRSQFASDDWKRCAERGIHGVMVPTELGGSGADLATTLLTLEGLGQGCRDNGLAFAIGSQILSTQETIVRFGSEDQQREWIPPLIAGDVLGAFAMTEPGSGSDAYSLTTTAERRDDGSYVLNGHKAYLTLGSRCAFVIVFASTKPGAGAWGLSTFLVPTDLDGVERLENRDKMGMRTTPFGDITLTDVVVPDSALIGREGAGASIFNAVLQVERSFVFATQVGAMERQLDAAVAYAREREQGGVPIGDHQAVSHRIADMKQRHETARLMLYRAALASVTGRDVAMSAALAKLTASEAGLDAALAASMVHGAKGYVSEFEVERDLRDAIGGLVYSGTSDIQRNIIARLLGLG